MVQSGRHTNPIVLPAALFLTFSQLPEMMMTSMAMAMIQGGRLTNRMASDMAMVQGCRHTDGMANIARPRASLHTPVALNGKTTHFIKVLIPKAAAHAANLIF